MLIYQASKDDLPELAVFARRTFREAYVEDMGAERIDHHLHIAMNNERFAEMFSADTFLIARQDDALSGFAQIGVVDGSYGKHLADFDHDGFELRRLYVDQRQQNLGLGSKLIQQVLQEPVLEDVRSLYLTTWEGNHGAQRLYKRFGFQQVGGIPEYDESGALEGHELVMLKSLIDP